MVDRLTLVLAEHPAAAGEALVHDPDRSVTTRAELEAARPETTLTLRQVMA